MNEKTAQALCKLLAQMQILDNEMQGINDYGDVTGFCEQHNALCSRFENTIHSLHHEVYSLRRRVQKYKEPDQQTHNDSATFANEVLGEPY